MPHDNDERLLTLDEVARTCRISERHLNRILASRRGPPTVRLGRRRFVRPNALAGWLAEVEEGRVRT